MAASCASTAAGEAMKKRRSMTTGPKRRNAPKVARRRNAAAADANEKIALLEHRLNEALEQQAATSDVLQVISSSPGELEPVFQAILKNATQICEAKFATLFRYDGDTFYAAAGIGRPSALVEAHRQRGAFKPIPGNTLYEVWRTKNTVHTEDDAAALEPGLHVRFGGARSSIGVIVIYRQEVRPFTDKQIALVTNFAAQAVIAIENTRLLSELRQRTDDLSEALEQQTATSQVLQVISSSPGELEPVFQAMLENAVRICEAKFGSLVLFEGNMYRQVALHNAPAAFVEEQAREPVRPLAASPTLSRVAGTKQVIHIDDILAEQPQEAIAKLGGARTVLCVPMLKDDRIVGVISIYRQEVRPFNDKLIELVSNFAAQAVIAIENPRLLSELRESLQQQTATSDVLKVISRSTFDLRTVLQTLVESAARLCRAERSGIRLVKDNLYHQVAIYGHSQRHKERMQREPLKPGRGSITGRVVLEGKSVHVIDAQAEPDPEVANRSRSGNIRTILGVPLQREGTPSGVLLLQRSIVQPFTDKEIGLAETFADQAVIAIENVRLFEEVQARTQELSESLDQQTATSDVLKVISNSPDELEPIFQSMLANGTRLCEAKFGIIWLCEGDEFRCGGLHNAPPALAGGRRRERVVRPHAASPLGRAARTKQVVYIFNVTAEQPYAGGNRLV